MKPAKDEALCARLVKLLQERRGGVFITDMCVILGMIDWVPDTRKVGDALKHLEAEGRTRRGAWDRWFLVDPSGG